MPLWKWILLIVFGSALFLFLSQTVPIVGSFSNNIWIKALLLLLGAIAVLGLYAVWVKVFERRKVWRPAGIHHIIIDLWCGSSDDC